MEYYVYTYFYEDGTAYYVGKGNGFRAFKKHKVPVPSRPYIQQFYFKTEIEALDTEIQLIALYGRQQDGGTLMNLSTGGPGPAGVVRSATEKQKCSDTQKRKYNKHGHHLTGRRGSLCANSLPYLITYPSGDTEEILGLTEFCRKNNLDPSCMRKVSCGKRLQHKGYKCSRI